MISASLEVLFTFCIGRDANELTYQLITNNILYELKSQLIP